MTNVVVTAAITLFYFNALSPLFDTIAPTSLQIKKKRHQRFTIKMKFSSFFYNTITYTVLLLLTLKAQ